MAILIILVVIILMVMPVFRCTKCRKTIWFKMFGFYGTLSHDTYCKSCYQQLKADGVQDWDLI